MFLCEYNGKTDTVALHGDINQVGYDWLDIRTLNTAPLYPSKLRRQIMNLFEGKRYRVYLGNEEIGDPEIIEISLLPKKTVCNFPSISECLVIRFSFRRISFLPEYFTLTLP